MDRPIKPEYRFFAYEYDEVTQRNQVNSPLLRLPAEIRNRIYDFTFDSATVKRDLSPSSAAQYLVEFDSPRLILVCRQIRFETRPFWESSTYHRLTIRMDSRHIADLVDMVGQPHCAHIVQIDMFQSLAGALQRKVREASVPGPFTGLWPTSGDDIFPELKRVVVTYPIDVADNAVEIGEALQMLFGNPDLDVVFKRAKFWR